MRAIIRNSRGAVLLLELNWDRLLYICTIVFALVAGAWVGSL